MNCRFNPTTWTGPSLGHIYMALVNQTMAHQSGGKFIFRAEDDQKRYLVHGLQRNDKQPYSQAQLRHTAATWLEDLAWMGINPDQVIYQSEQHAATHAAIAQLMPTLHEPDWYGDTDFPTVLTGVPYPAAFYLTATTVWYDHQEGVDLLIAGEDLLTRFSLYRFLEYQWGLAPFPHIYLPRLVTATGAISKTLGNYQVQELRSRGYTPSAVATQLRLACLKDPGGDWTVDNIKERPSL